MLKESIKVFQNFANTLDDAIVSMPTEKAEEVSFGSTQNWEGVKFSF